MSHTRVYELERVVGAEIKVGKPVFTTTCSFFGDTEREGHSIPEYGSAVSATVANADFGHLFVYEENNPYFILECDKKGWETLAVILDEQRKMVPTLGQFLEMQGAQWLSDLKREEWCLLFDNENSPKYLITRDEAEYFGKMLYQP